MRLIRIILPLLLIPMFPSLALAESSPMYIGVNFATFDSKYSDVELDGGIINLGFDLNNYFAFELSGGASETTNDEATGAKSKVDYVASAFLRFNLRFNRVTVYALGGYSQVKSTSSLGSITVEDTSSGGSYGYGIDFYGTRDLALSFRRVEFVDIEETSGNTTTKTHVGATMVGITYYFDKPKIYSRY